MPKWWEIAKDNAAAKVSKWWEKDSSLLPVESKSLVAKLPKSNDKRATYIILTAKGADLLYKYPPTLQEKLSKRLKKLTPEQIEELDRNIELLTLIMDVEDMDAAPLLTIEEMTSHPE